MNSDKEYNPKSHVHPTPKKDKKKHKKEDLETKVQRIVTKELKTGTKKFVSKVHPEVLFRYNSFNIIVGNQGTSKTTTVMKELMKLAYIEHDYHLLIYVTNNESDETFQKLCHFIDFQIIQCTYEEVEDVFEELIHLKHEYNEMVDGNAEMDDTILDELYVENFDKQRLHTFILFDDASYIFEKKSKSKFKKWLCQCRHLNITAVCIIQIWTSLDPSLKSQLASVTIGKGFSRERTMMIVRQIATDVTFDEFWEAYIGLKQYQKVHFDCVENTMKVL